MSSRMTTTIKMAKNARYESYTLPNGTTGWDNGDTYALRMRCVPNETLAQWVDNIRDLPDGTTMSQYAHLNIGHQRMTFGNILRAHWRKSDG
jgi:hypothetical protein